MAVGAKAHADIVLSTAKSTISVCMYGTDKACNDMDKSAICFQPNILLKHVDFTAVYSKHNTYEMLWK